MTGRLARTFAVATVLAAAAALALAADPPPEMTAEQKAEIEAWEKASTPGPPHKQLAATVGTYAMVVKSWIDPAAPPLEDAATAKRSMELDGRVLVEHVTGTMMGAPFTGHGMMGYNNVTGKYWSTWNDTSTTGILVTDGTCDSKQACSFWGTMTNAMTKKSMAMRMTTRWTSPATEIFELYGPDKDGKEMKMMEIVYTKKP